MDDNIHAPTIALAVPSDSSIPTNGTETNGNAAHKSLLDLMAARDSVMAEMSALSSVLESHNVDMSTPLVTPDGFPRADLDVAQIRTTRAKLIRLRNDYKGYMDAIEKGLHEHHAQLATQGASSNESNGDTANGDTANGDTANGDAASDTIAQILTPVRAPFAKVNSVSENSPADAAGLKAGDMVTLFGDADERNHDNLQRLAQVVKDNEGRQVLVKVRRALKDMDLMLTPRSGWGGRGSLGCHLVPV